MLSRVMDETEIAEKSVSHRDTEATECRGGPRIARQG
jgi:hypothetical protein